VLEAYEEIMGWQGLPFDEETVSTAVRVVLTKMSAPRERETVAVRGNRAHMNSLTQLLRLIREPTAEELDCGSYDAMYEKLRVEIGILLLTLRAVQEKSHAKGV
jgi:hypothetical protein